MLSVQQLLYINSLLYSRSPSIYRGEDAQDFCGCTLADFASKIDPAANRNGTADETEWARVAEKILEDMHLCAVRIIDSFRDPDTGEASCFLEDADEGEAIVAFRGTGKGEWRDNFIAGAHMEHAEGDPTISPQQQKALDYLARIDLAPYHSVTLTGHSKGGNKAKLCALLDDRVDRCISFDGQGFSDEFFAAHKKQIDQNARKIQNHNVAGDFVNILLNDVGETTYYEGHRVKGNFWKNHDPSAFLSDDGMMVPGAQNMEMQELDMFLNSMLRCANEEQKIALLAFAGDVTAAVRGKEASRSRLMDVLCDSANRDQISFMLAYLLKYEHETSRITDAIESAFDRFGFEDLHGLIGTINDLAESKFYFNLFSRVLRLCDNIPKWALQITREKLLARGVSLPFADAQILHFLRILARAGEETKNIDVRRESGYDIGAADAADKVIAGAELARRIFPGGR